MTNKQLTNIHTAIDYLNMARKYLDDACFRCGEVSDKEYTKLRSAYSAVCEAIDKL